MALGSKMIISISNTNLMRFLSNDMHVSTGDNTCIPGVTSEEIEQAAC